MSRIIEIAAAIVAETNNFKGWSQPLDAVRAYAPRYELKDLADLKVTVVPKSLQGELATRRDFQTDYQFDVAVQKHLNVVDDEHVDAMLDLVQQMAAHWRFRGVQVDGIGATCVKVTNEPVYSPDHLTQMQVFTSVLTLTFRMVEGLP